MDPGTPGIHPGGSGGDPIQPTLGFQTSFHVKQTNNPREAPARSGVEQEEKIKGEREMKERWMKEKEGGRKLK
jgi:hypothetical protein